MARDAKLSRSSKKPLKLLVLVRFFRFFFFSNIFRKFRRTSSDNDTQDSAAEDTAAAKQVPVTKGKLTAPKVVRGGTKSTSATPREYTAWTEDLSMKLVEAYKKQLARGKTTRAAGSQLLKNSLVAFNFVSTV
jgi:hypothetical protein